LRMMERKREHIAAAERELATQKRALLEAEGTIDEGNDEDNDNDNTSQSAASEHTVSHRIIRFRITITRDTTSRGSPRRSRSKSSKRPVQNLSRPSTQR
jgi:hypothetical protein